MQSDQTQVQKAALPWAHLRLPPFPQVALKVLQLVHSDNVSLVKLCELISADPAFAAEVLTVANSALYSPRYPSGSILQAVTVLGANTLQGMCITVGVRAYLGKTMSDPAMRCLWRHNLATALIAEQLASHGIGDKNIAYTAGILHDMGRIALAVVQPKKYAELLNAYRGAPIGLLEAERALFGQDHCETGSQLLRDWKLPQSFEAVVSEHHQARRTDGAWDLGELMKVSCAMADVAGFAACPGCEVQPWDELVEQLPARERRLFHSELESLTAEVAAAIHVMEAI
jgi:putative nucleotidyltransferase with HDIG domain